MNYEEFYIKEYREKLEPKLQEVTKKYSNNIDFWLNKVEERRVGSNNTRFVRYYVSFMLPMWNRIDGESFHNDVSALNGFVLKRVECESVNSVFQRLEYETYFTEDELVEANTNFCQKIKNGFRLKRLFFKGKVKKLWQSIKKK